MTYLLISPTRSSIVGFAQGQELPEILRTHNEATEAPTEPLRPWRLAELRPQRGEKAAKAKAFQVAQRSGFRARLKALRDDEAENEFKEELLKSF